MALRRSMSSSIRSRVRGLVAVSTDSSVAGGGIETMAGLRTRLRSFSSWSAFVNQPDQACRTRSTRSCTCLHLAATPRASLAPSCPSRALGGASTAAASGQPPSLHRRRSFCSNAGGDPSKLGSSSSGSPLEVHITHVDAHSKQEPGLDASEANPRMIPEEDRKPIGAAVGPNAADTGEPTTVRFLDVPGSEETREEKMTVVFTCMVCDTRTAKTFAKLSYNKGVVVARCPGCHNLHLIADRLGWFEEAGDAAGGWDIEKITTKIGEAECHVVNEDNVMELTLVDIAGKSGAASKTAGEHNGAAPAATGRGKG